MKEIYIGGIILRKTKGETVMNRNSSGSGIKSILIIFAVLFVIAMFELCTEPSASDKWYQEHKEAIDTYNRNHKDDWKGYQGTRRNSWAEDQKLEHDGYDPDEYRRQHGY